MMYAQYPQSTTSLYDWHSRNHHISRSLNTHPISIFDVIFPSRLSSGVVSSAVGIQARGKVWNIEGKKGEKGCQGVVPAGSAKWSVVVDPVNEGKHRKPAAGVRGLPPLPTPLLLPILPCFSLPFWRSEMHTQDIEYFQWRIILCYEISRKLMKSTAMIERCLPPQSHFSSFPFFHTCFHSVGLWWMIML